MDALSLITLVGFTVAAIVYGLDRFDMLPKRKSIAEAAAELDLADRANQRLHGENSQLRDENAELRATRSMEPILDRLDKNAELQAKVLERLVHHNGAFQHMEHALAEIEEGLKLLTGFIAGLLDIDTSGTPATMTTHTTRKD